MATENLELDKVALTNTVEEWAGYFNDNMDKIDAAVADCQLTGGTGISIEDGEVSLDDTAVTAGTYGPSANVTGNDGNTIKVPQITVNGQGQVTAVNERTFTAKNTSVCLPLSGGTVTGAVTFSNTTDSSSKTTGAVKISGGLGVAKTIYGNKVYNAVWNDYAECRKAEVLSGGWCVREDKDGVMKMTTKRLMAGCRFTSDTYGHLMGETEEARTPVAVAGRVLARPYYYKELDRYKIGKAVCSAPGGAIDVMSRLECILFPDRIIGYVSEIPDYEEWVCGDGDERVSVHGRIWVQVR